MISEELDHSVAATSRVFQTVVRKRSTFVKALTLIDRNKDNTKTEILKTLNAVKNGYPPPA